VIDPIVNALSIGGETFARARVAQAIRTLETMPLERVDG
jgi:hypothetical protein